HMLSLELLFFYKVYMGYINKKKETRDTSIDYKTKKNMEEKERPSIITKKNLLKQLAKTKTKTSQYNVNLENLQNKDNDTSVLNCKNTEKYNKCNELENSIEQNVDHPKNNA
ncbi:hypothetical protein COBT_004203, partial [Conglomerata obtusa]